MLDALDYLVILVYLVGTIWLGLWTSRRIHSGSDFFLAGRRLPWWAIGVSLVATDIGGTDIIGVGGQAYVHGMAVANFEWIGCVPAMIVCAFVFAPHFWRLGITTIPELFERRYHVSLRVVVASCWLVFMACNLGVMLFASAKMLNVWLGINLEGLSLLGIPLEGKEVLLSVVVIAGLTGLYTTAGGLAAVVYTDVVQGIVMIIGCLAVLAIGVVEVGGFESLRERVAEHEAAVEGDSPTATHHDDLILPVTTTTPFPWTGIYFGLALVLSPAYWIGNQAIIQRAFGAKSDFEAKAAYVSGALLKNLIPVIIAVPGLIAFALYPDLEEGDHAFPVLASRLLPTGIRGVFMAAFVAALMSSIDSYLNSAATIACHDLIGRFMPLSQSTSARMGRVVTIMLVLWAIGFAVWCSTLRAGVYDIFQTLMSFFQGPALAVLLAGVFWRRANTPGAIVGFVAGVSTAVGLFTLNIESVRTQLGWQPLFHVQAPYLYYSVWSFVVASSVLAVVSLLTRAQPLETIQPFLYSRSAGKLRPDADAAPVAIS